MQCTKPITLVNKYTKEKLTVPCGKCIQCRKSNTAEWTMRLLAELNYTTNNYFITLTYDNNHLPYNMNLIPKDLRDFWKRFRKAKLANTNFKYFSCGEYGDQEQRPHYHAIILNTNLDINKFYTWTDRRGKKMISSEEIDKVWGKGNTTIGGVERQSIEYVTGYIKKKLNGEKAKEVYGENNTPFATMSKGIGKQWTIDNAENLLKMNIIIGDNGMIKTIPRTMFKWLAKINPDIESEGFKAGQELIRADRQIREGIEVLKYKGLKIKNDQWQKDRYLIMMGEKGKRENAILKEYESNSLEKIIKGNL